MVISSPTKNFFLQKCVIIPQIPYSSKWIHFISSLMVCLIHWNRNGSNTGMRVNHDSMQKGEPKFLVRTGHGFHNNEFLIPISNLKNNPSALINGMELISHSHSCSLLHCSKHNLNSYMLPL